MKPGRVADRRSLRALSPARWSAAALTTTALALTGCASPVDEAQQLIARYYVEPVDRDELTENAIDGMLADLDDYSRLRSPFEIGVTTDPAGADVKMLTGFAATFVGSDLHVLYTWPGSNADRSGVRSGDRIMSINDTAISRSIMPDVAAPEAVLSVTLADHARRDRDLVFRLRPWGTAGDADWNWKPRPDRSMRVEHTSVRWVRTLPGPPNIGYVYLADFNRGAETELMDTIRALRGRGIDGLVLDLRFNPGGIGTVVNHVKNLFIADGVIGIRDEPRGAGRRVIRAKPGHALFADLPLVVLVNEDSASGSEDLAGCLQDRDRATIIGTRTHGKGSIQSIFDLAGGRRLVLTTGYFYTPDGHRIQRTDDDPGGIVPDEVISLPAAERSSLQAALRHLEPPAECRDEIDRFIRATGARNPLGPLPPSSDPQLRRAIERLTADL